MTSAVLRANSTVAFFRRVGADPLTLFYTAHLLKHRAEISPIGIMVTTSPILDDPAMETFRSVFGHLLKTFEILIATRILQDLQKPGPS